MRCSFAAVVLSVIATGCYARHGLEADPPPPRDTGVRFDAGDRPDVPDFPDPTRTVDLLFVIDNSLSMVEEQASLAAELPLLINILVTGDFDGDGDLAGDGEIDDEDFQPVTELAVGIVTTDMGTGGFMIPSCDEAAVGDDGIMRSRGTGSDGCSTVYPEFLTFRSGTDPETFAFDVTCIIRGVGTVGCGIEQPLEAALKSLSPSAPQSWTAPGYVPPIFVEGTTGHGDGANAGFIHPNGVLAVVVVSDDDDCSASDPNLFDPAAPDFRPSMNLRCFRQRDTALHPIERYADGLIQLRQNPRRLIFAPVVGVPPDLVPATGERIEWDGIFDDERMTARVGSEAPGELVPSCNVPGRGVAYPPIRTLATARSLESRGVRVGLASICDESYGGILQQIISAL